MKFRILGALMVALLGSIGVLVLDVSKASAVEFDPLCEGDGSARVEFLYGQHSGVSSTLITATQETFTHPGHQIGFQILSTNPSRYNFEWVVSTDSAQTNIIDSTRLAGYSFHPEGSSQEGFGRWEFGGSMRMDLGVDYYLTVNLYLPDGT